MTKEAYFEKKKWWEIGKYLLTENFSLVLENNFMSSGKIYCAIIVIDEISFDLMERIEANVFCIYN